MTAAPGCRQGFRPLSRRRRRRHPLPHLSGHTRPRDRSSPAAPSRDRYARYTEEGAPYADNMQRLLRKFETARTWCPPAAGQRGQADKYGVIYYGSTSPAMDEAIHMIEAGRHSLDRLRVRASRSIRACRASSPTTDFVFVVEQNRDAQTALADRQRVQHRSGAAGADPALRRHADHRTLHRRRDQRASRRAQGHAAAQGGVHDLSRQAKIPPSRPAEERARLYAPRLRGLDLDAVRGLRPRLDHRRHHRRLLRALRRAASGGEDFRHRLLVEDARPISSAIRTASTRCTAACRRCSPARTSPTAA